MQRCVYNFFKPGKGLVVILILLLTLGVLQQFPARTPAWKHTIVHLFDSQPRNASQQSTGFHRRSTCPCERPYAERNATPFIHKGMSSALCSDYATLRGPHQRVLAISLFGPKENNLFIFNRTLSFLHALVDDMKRVYPDWILRVYHDATITHDVVCPVECTQPHVDFCNVSALGNLGQIGDFVPPKIWRFLPVGDPLVDVMGSRDLDSPLIQRELDAVTEWLASGKAWHAMRDHPFHSVPMLGGMWGFRTELNRAFADTLLRIMLNRTLISQYGGRNDQTFLAQQVWPHIQGSVIAHDSFLCTEGYGKNSKPWPTRRPPFNGTDCFVGCVRPCCEPSKDPFGECPMPCRPKDHPEWKFC